MSNYPLLALDELSYDNVPLDGTEWDAIIVGAGHNGLSCANYLARLDLQGNFTNAPNGIFKKILIVEKQQRIGGACTLKRWHLPDNQSVLYSPCAYLIGLFHPYVIKELEMEKRGLRYSELTSELFIPFLDGTSITVSHDDTVTLAEIKRVAPEDIEGWQKMEDLCARVRQAIRPNSDEDLWLGTPTRKDVEERLNGDEEAIHFMFDWSMWEFLDHFLKNEKLKLALMGQGIIGSNSSPFDKGTAYIYFHHLCGNLAEDPGSWGYVIGGMGQISRILYEAAKNVNVTVNTGCEVSKILPGEGVVMESGTLVHSKVIIANCDPRSCLKLLGDHTDESWKTQVLSIPQNGCTLKANLVLKELPNFKAIPGVNEAHHLMEINLPLTKEEWTLCFEACKRGELPPKLWCEIYLQTAVDSSVAPPGFHHMSMFCQYVPYNFNWSSRREEVKKLVIDTLSSFCSNLPEMIIDIEVLGPPDIEDQVGLWGGHIFQGECLPNYMWENRLKTITPMKGFYLCGASIHPGGSVIGINGRNAAVQIIKSYQ